MNFFCLVHKHTYEHASLNKFILMNRKIQDVCILFIICEYTNVHFFKTIEMKLNA